MITVLVVDDSAFMRKILTTLIAQDTTIRIVGVARSGEEALKQIAELDPDVVTMDIEMPGMDGLTTLQNIMKTSPRPVIMISTLTEKDADATLKALEYGALDYMSKSMSNNQDFFAQELCQKIKAVSRKKALMKLRFSRTQLTSNTKLPTSSQILPPSNPCVGARTVVAIGVSTGGPPAVQKVLSSLPATFPACILIAQHMPATFTGPFAKRLDSVCNISVSEAQSGDKLKSGHAYVSPGGKHLKIQMKGPLMELVVTADPVSALYKPSATELMDSVAKTIGRKALGVMLTGMGSDGLEGARTLKERGGYLLAQNEQSCVVYGMPKAVVDAGLADQVLDIEHIAQAIMTAVKG